MTIAETPLWVVCIDPERGQYMAYDAHGTRGYGHTEEHAVVSALRKLGLVIQAIDTNAEDQPFTGVRG
jgi:hypothetical protein